MTDIDFKTHEAKLTSKFSKTLFSDIIQNREKTLRQFLVEKVKDPGKVIESLREVIEAKIYAHIDHYAVIQYALMSQSNQWTDAGMDRVKLSAIRLWLQIPVKDEVAFSDYSRFEEFITKKLSDYQLIGLTAEDLKWQLKSLKLELLGKHFDQHSMDKVNNLLEIVESHRRVMMGLSGAYHSMIFGVAKTVPFGKYKLHFFAKEEMRTPNAVHYIVALIEENQIAIRQEVCQYVFYNKWVSALEKDLFMVESMRGQDEENIAEGIKQVVFKAFGATDEDSFLTKEDEFISLMMENLVCHELAHDAMEDMQLSDTELTIVESLATKKETILSVVNEILTEWMPQVNDIRGPLLNIAEIGISGDSLKATKMLYMYLSDAWFLDTDTQFMYPYTDHMFALLLPYIQEKGLIDFIGLRNAIKSSFELLLNWYRGVISEMVRKIKSMTINDHGEMRNFEYIRDRSFVLRDMYFGEDSTLTDRQKEFNLWMGYFSFVEDRDPSQLQNLFSFVSAKEQDLQRLVMQRFASRENQEKFGKDIRRYVVYSMKKVGIMMSEDETL